MWQFEYLDGVGEDSVDQGGKVMRVVHAREVDARVPPVAYQTEGTVQRPSLRLTGDADAVRAAGPNP
ncbi:uncharacterized protein SOCE836_026050 [Sorangium cellulosum]|uniref:Uncharacterized protein n=1 Tax=Sorangium cellulosum TaxID=56 RepID=A0A4P2QKF2_SORCE|nr:uncharacterized protein SOCE836_026050 [Sorangium cellulosum]WCQ89893.1 hypothetical protein NQZ70_02591 [Sorangium sp. Soce836]